MTYSLSPSSLNLFVNCPKCFWLSVVKKISRPPLIMPSIVNRIDSIVKGYFDRYRVLGELPPIIAGQIKGRLPRGMPNSLRHDEGDGIVLWGRPDDYLQLESGAMLPFDHKSRASPPVDVHPAHQLQLDTYSYLLGKSGYETTDKAFLGYYYPDGSDSNDLMRILCKVVEVETDPDRVRDLVAKARGVLDGGMPISGENCGYCRWIEQIRHID